MFKNNFDLEIIKHYCDNNGRFVIVDVISEGKKLTLVNMVCTCIGMHQTTTFQTSLTKYLAP